MRQHDNMIDFLACTNEEERKNMLILQDSGRTIANAAHGASVAAGWWSHLSSGAMMSPAEVHAAVPTKLMLIVSEIAEGMEGHRKGKMDEHLPWRQSLEVELADAVIRIGDLAGALGYDLGAAIAEKMHYNAHRPDHKIEARRSDGGKTY